ncbi:MAG: M48 family peptidase [Acidobacteriaceae bacterium]|nr:M48 family peptidase [Acidobacteriaceae bacterium]
MLQLVKMQIETALFFESVEQIYTRVFRTIKPRTALPEIAVRFRKYANANSRIRLEEGRLRVDVTDLLENAPAPIQEALAFILICKLFRKEPDPAVVARYRRYLNRADIRKTIHLVKRERGWKAYSPPHGKSYDLVQIFEDLNFLYFHGLMARPELGWSLRPSRRTLGHYDPSHNVIVITSLLDCQAAPKVLVSYIMFHEMLHLRYPTEHKGARRCVHTKEFKQAERAFEGYEKANLELKRFLEQTA